LRSGLGSGAIFADLFVSPEGKVEGCEVTYSQQTKAQSVRLCTNLVGLTVSNPAVGPDGKREYGVFQFGRIVVETVSSGPGSPPKFEVPPDLEVNVNELPGKNQKKLRVGLTILVDDHGAVVACQGAQDAPADYAQVACGQAKLLRTRVRTSAAGTAVRYVSNFVVDFEKA